MIKIPDGATHVLKDGRFAKDEHGICVAYLANGRWGIAYHMPPDEIEGAQPIERFKAEKAVATMEYYAAC